MDKVNEKSGDSVIHEKANVYERESFLRAKAAWQLIGAGRSTFYALQNPQYKQYDKSFPAPYKIGARARVWSTVELMAWVESRPALPEGRV